MRVVLAQFDIQWEQPTINLDRVRSLIPSDTDLIIFPEMFLTGFAMDPKGLAETMESAHVQSLQSMADESQTAIMGSIIVKDGDGIYNRLMLFSPNGPIQFYDKRHLFTYGGESRMYTPGKNDGIFHLGDWKICGRVCYDLRFPAWSRNNTAYDLLIYVANWPKARHHAWRNLIQARAIENQAYCIGVNRIGRDGNDLDYLGGSMAVDYNGDIIADAEENDALVQVELSKEKMIHYREKLPFLKDQDRFTIHD